jgi:hypothetical protein
MHASCCCHDPQNALKEVIVAIPAAMQARCCCDSQNALVEEGCYPCAAMQARCCWSGECSCGKVCYPALSCRQAAVMIHRMLWWKKGCYPRCHASSLLL